MLLTTNAVFVYDIGSIEYILSMVDIDSLVLYHLGRNNFTVYYERYQSLTVARIFYDINVTFVVIISFLKCDESGSWGILQLLFVMHEMQFMVYSLYNKEHISYPISWYVILLTLVFHGNLTCTN